MKTVEIYTTTYCPYCVRAKALLTRKGVEFVEHNMDDAPEELAKLKAQTGWRTVPQIFIKGEFIGGCDDLEKLDREGRLDAMLN